MTPDSSFFSSGVGGVSERFGLQLKTINNKKLKKIKTLTLFIKNSSSQKYYNN